MKITTSQLAALLEGVRRYSEDEISFWELKDLIDEVQAAKPLFKKLSDEARNTDSLHKS